MTELDPLRQAMGRANIPTIAALSEASGVHASTINRVMFEADSTVQLQTVLKIGGALGLTFDDANDLVTAMRARAREAEARA